MRIFGLICAIIALLIAFVFLVQVLVSLSPWKVKVEHATEPLKRRWKKASNVLIGIAAVLGAVGVGLLAASPAEQVTMQNTHSMQEKDPTDHSSPVSLRFVDPSETVPWCITITGEGAIPEGDSLLIFDSPAVDLTGTLISPIRYGLKGAVTRTSRNSWKIKDAQILQQGDVDKYDKLFGVLVSNQTAESIQSMVVSINHPKSGQTAWWRYGKLPQGSYQLRRFS